MLFISPKKLLLFWRSLYFCSGIFCQVGKGLNKNVNAIFKIYGIKNWETDDYSTHIAQYLKKKDNLTMKFDQLTNYYWRNILLGKWHSKYGGKTSPWPFFLKKRTKLSISADQQSRALYSLFLLYVQVEGYGNILKLRCRQCFYHM